MEFGIVMEMQGMERRYARWAVITAFGSFLTLQIPSIVAGVTFLNAWCTENVLLYNHFGVPF
jgi:hypothetical protein